MPFTIIALYHFFDFQRRFEQRDEIKETMQNLSITGSLLLAAEGINGTIAGTSDAMEPMLAYLREHVTHSPFEYKQSVSEEQPFARAKVRLKKETISIGEPTPREAVGTYVEPKDWNALLDDPETILIDTRNGYEVHIGTFENAIDPKIRKFKQLPRYVRETLKPPRNAKIATFCTGGIRCEKFTAWLKHEGYENVYHLKGGILKYLEEIPPSESKWQGECYVFDERIAVDHALQPSQTISRCPTCDHTLTPADRQHPDYQKDVRCPHCNTSSARNTAKKAIDVNHA